MKVVVVSLALAFGVAAGRAASAQGSTSPSATVRSEPFPDVPKDHWAFDAVEQLRKLGILRGYPATAAPKPAPKRKPAPRKPRTV